MVKLDLTHGRPFVVPRFLGGCLQAQVVAHNGLRLDGLGLVDQGVAEDLARSVAPLVLFLEVFGDFRRIELVDEVCIDLADACRSGDGPVCHLIVEHEVVEALLIHAGTGQLFSQSGLLGHVRHKSLGRFLKFLFLGCRDLGLVPLGRSLEI